MSVLSLLKDIDHVFSIKYFCQASFSNLVLLKPQS
jgi:hypothetical protein